MSEAQRQRDENESQGIRIRVMNEAEGNKARVVMETEAEASKIVATARAQAGAILEVSRAISEKNGVTAAEIDLAKNYLHWISTMGKNNSKGSTHTVLLPANLADVGGMVAAGLSMLRSTSEQHDQNKAH